MIETVEAMGNSTTSCRRRVSMRSTSAPPTCQSASVCRRNNDGTAAFDDALATIVAACNRHGIVPGIHATGKLAERRLEQGFRMITISGDMLAMRTSMAQELAIAKSAPAPAAPTLTY